MMKHALTALALLAAVPGLAAAEVDGTLGASSTGSLKLSLDVQEEERIQITGLEDIVQTIEKGVSWQDQPNFDGRIIFDHNGDYDPFCVKMDDQGTYTLAWKATPFTDGPNIEEYDLRIWAGSNSSGVSPTIILSQTTISSEMQDTMAGLPSKEMNGPGCGPSNPEGNLSIGIYTGSALRTFDTVGTYEATITLTVRPD